MTGGPDYAANMLPPDLLQGIGEVVVRWGRLEFQLQNLLIVGFSLTRPTGRALTVGMEIGVLCGTLKTLATSEQWIADKGLRDEIQSLATEVRKASQNRHDYAHGVFGFSLDAPDQFARYLFKSAAQRINPAYVPLTVERLKEVADEAEAFVDRATNLAVRLKASRRK